MILYLVKNNEILTQQIYMFQMCIKIQKNKQILKQNIGIF